MSEQGATLEKIKAQALAARERQGRPEDSVQIRAVVLAIVIVGVMAVIAQAAVPPSTAIGTLVLIPIGFVFSHYRRNERNIILKLLLAAALLVALGQFLSAVRYVTSVDEARVSLASLFLWVQVIHSFDLPRLRDLAFSVAASIVLMAEAGSLSLDTRFGLFLIPFAILGGVWLYVSQRAIESRAGGEVRIGTPRGAPKTSRRRAIPFRLVALTTVIALLAGGVVFITVPRIPGARVIAPPFSLTQNTLVPNFSGQVVNPGVVTTTAGGIASFSSVGYPGFGQSVDLRARGSLSDDVVMKVRSAQAEFWRGQAYDTFDGTTWTASDTTTRSISGWTPWPVPDPQLPLQTEGPSHALTQTFYIQEQQPNIAFAAYRPEELYFPASNAQVDNYLSIRTPILLDPGLIYSVVSAIPDATPAMLREAPTDAPEQFLTPYTQLPAALPQRVVDLAHQITDPQPTTYDKVMAVQEWLQGNTRYNLNIPPDPPGVDAVDYFLFVRRQGFCEHIAASMAILLRAVGIPTRFAVGFDTGERNPLTGYFEVRESDAHSWVEVYYPTIGWMEYDPTHAVPPADPGLANAFIAPQVLRAIGRFFARVTPAPVKWAMGAAVRGVTDAARWALGAWPVVLAFALLSSLGGLFATVLRRKRKRGPPPSGAAAAFASVCSTFASRGSPRPPQRTPREHLAELLATDGVARDALDDLTVVFDTFEREAFARENPSPDEVTGSLQAAERVRELARP